MFSNCVEYQDSCFGGGLWEHIYMEVEVLSDSTFQGFDPWTQPELATGKLYANDSIYYRIFYPSPPTYNRWKEFRGFKLYSFVGIEELNKPENELMISPQPASDVMHIQSTQVLFTQKEPPKLYDMSGKEIKLPVQFINANTYKVDVRGLSPGVFILAIKTEKGVLKKKFIVQH
ncbi:MAG: T9SS type A sorting domain-containing protein [Bacteroidota bacterium]|nr:T9SS type A sorting domain-containing protein [Bacteroidota bacterium]